MKYAIECGYKIYSTRFNLDSCAALCSYDTRLTAAGKEGAKKAEAVAKNLEPQPELLVISPLTR